MNDEYEIAADENEPTANSSLDALAAYALLKQHRIIARDKMNGEDLWLMGQALEWAFQKTPYGEWEQWWKDKGFKKTYVWQARTLHEKATFDQVKDLGLTEALRQYEVMTVKKPMAKTETAVGGKTTHPSNGQAAKPNADEGDQADADEQLAAEEEEKELKEYQKALRKQTPKTRAVAILHAMEALLADLKQREEDENDDLSNTFDQIIELAEAAKELDHDEQDS